MVRIGSLWVVKSEVNYTSLPTRSDPYFPLPKGGPRQQWGRFPKGVILIVGETVRGVPYKSGVPGIEDSYWTEAEEIARNRYVEFVHVLCPIMCYLNRAYFNTDSEFLASMS